MVEDVVRLMDHLHIARARVVGYSMGGSRFPVVYWKPTR